MMGAAVLASTDDDDRVIYPRGRAVTASPMHFAIAKALYDMRPFVVSSTQTTLGGKSLGRAFDWDGAPAFYQTDLLELAHGVVELIERGTVALPQAGTK